MMYAKHISQFQIGMVDGPANLIIPVQVKTVSVSAPNCQTATVNTTGRKRQSLSTNNDQYLHCLILSPPISSRSESVLGGASARMYLSGDLG